MKKVFAAGLLLILLTVVCIDARLHFSQDIVLAKQSVRSAQRHWSLFYTQNHVYKNASFRYLDDFAKIREIIIPHQLLLTDKATSYYAASELPVYVPNIHKHHNRAALSAWKLLLDRRHACYLDQPERLIEFSRFIHEWQQSQKSARLPFTYILVNKDQLNSNLRLDCLSQTRRAMVEGLDSLASIEYDGEHLRLYKLDEFAMASSARTLEDRERSANHDVEIQK